MPTPLPHELSSVLRTDSTAALAALMVIAASHRDLLAWAARMLGSEPPGKTEPSGKARQRQHARKQNGADLPAKAKRSSRSAPDVAYRQRRRSDRDAADQSLLGAMRENPDATIGDWAESIGRSRSSAVSALKRLRDAGKAESVGRKWKLTEEPAPREPPPKWTAPVRGTDRAATAHLTAASQRAVKLAAQARIFPFEGREAIWIPPEDETAVLDATGGALLGFQSDLEGKRVEGRRGASGTGPKHALKPQAASSQLAGRRKQNRPPAR